MPGYRPSGRNAPKINHREIDRGDPSRKLGFGSLRIDRGSLPQSYTAKAQDTRVQRMIGALKRQLSYPTFNVPEIETVTVHYGGPLTDADIEASFGDRLDPLNSSINSPPPGATEIDTTFAGAGGVVQNPTLICAVCFQFDVEPLEFTAPVNWVDAQIESAVTKPVSPDVYTDSDLNNFAGGSFNALGLQTGNIMIPGDLEWGWWQGMAAYWMSRAYNLVWQTGANKTILNDQLRYTMFVPGNAQNGSASSSEVDINYFLRQANDYYRSAGSALTALSVDRQRIGPFLVNETPVGNISVFHPTRAFERVGATYGGAGVRPLISRNPEFRRLASPYLLKPGVPLGLYAKQSHDPSRQQMANWLSINSGLGSGSTPAPFSNASDILVGSGASGTATGSTVGTAGVTGAELQLNTSPALVSQQMPTGRIPMKGGRFAIRVGLKGWELDSDTADALQDPDIMSLISAECGGCSIT